MLNFSFCSLAAVSLTTRRKWKKRNISWRLGMSEHKKRDGKMMTTLSEHKMAENDNDDDRARAAQKSC